jgi:hypothetical protein|tara:strand:+ start:920 stop:1243 length:324 start_codon:yes stop_codon:yes gene_type:complete
MPRFEMSILLALENKVGEVSTEEYDMICWADNPNDDVQVHKTATQIVDNHTDFLIDLDKIVLFGIAYIRMKSDKTMNLLFENHEVDKDKIKRVMDLYSHDCENKKIH